MEESVQRFVQLHRACLRGDAHTLAQGLAEGDCWETPRLAETLLQLDNIACVKVVWERLSPQDRARVLYMAIFRVKKDLVAWMLSHDLGVDVNARVPHAPGFVAGPCVALHVAAVVGGRECLSLLLAHGALPNQECHEGTPLAMCASHGHLECLKLLHGVVRGEGSTEALLDAAQRGRVECVRWLLDNGAPIEGESEVGDKALMVAAYNKHLECAKLLYSRGAQLSEELLDHAIDGGSVPMVKWLLELGLEHGDQVLFEPLRQNNTAMVELVLSRGQTNPSADFAQHSNLSKRAKAWLRGLHNDPNCGAVLWVTSLGYLVCLQMLVLHGADINMHIGYDTTVKLAIEFKQPECLRWLLDNGADMMNKHAALRWAVDNGDHANAALILSRGLNPPPLVKRCQSPYHTAPFNSPEERASWMLRLGSAMEFRCTLCCFCNGCRSVDRFSEQQQRAAPTRSWSPLPEHAAASLGHVECLQFLDDAGRLSITQPLDVECYANFHHVHSHPRDELDSQHPLINAILCDQPAAAEWLLDRTGSVVGAKEVLLAAVFGKTECLKMLHRRLSAEECVQLKMEEWLCALRCGGREHVQWLCCHLVHKYPISSVFSNPSAGDLPDRCYLLELFLQHGADGNVDHVAWEGSPGYHKSIWEGTPLLHMQQTRDMQLSLLWCGARVHDSSPVQPVPCYLAPAIMQLNRTSRLAAKLLRGSLPVGLDRLVMLFAFPTDFVL